LLASLDMCTSKKVPAELPVVSVAWQPEWKKTQLDRSPVKVVVETDFGHDLP